MHVCSVLSQVWKSKTKNVFGVLNLLLLILVLTGTVEAQQTALIRASDGVVYQIRFRNIDPKNNYEIGNLTYDKGDFIDDFSVYDETGQVKLCPSTQDNITWELYTAARAIAKTERHVPILDTSELAADLEQSVRNLGVNTIADQSIDAVVDLLITDTALENLNVVSILTGAPSFLIKSVSLVTSFGEIEIKLRRVLYAYSLASRYATIAQHLQKLANHHAPRLWDAINAGEVLDFPIRLEGRLADYSDETGLFDPLHLQLLAQVYQEYAARAAEIGKVLGENPDASDIASDVLGIGSFLSSIGNFIDFTTDEIALERLNTRLDGSIYGTLYRNIELIYKDADFDLKLHGFCYPSVSTTFPRSINEGESITYTIVLKSAPESTAVLALSDDNPDITFSPELLTFTPDNWYIHQTVRINAANDEDTQNEIASPKYTVTGYGPPDIEDHIYKEAFILIIDEGEDILLLPQDAIPIQSLTLGGFPVTVDVAQHFLAQNRLTYEVEINPSNIVSASISGSRVTIIPISPGSATVIVTARGALNTSLTAIQTIPVLVQQTDAVISRPTNTDPIWRPIAISNLGAKGLRVGASVIVNGLASGNVLNVRDGAGTTYQDIGDVTNGDYGLITDGPRDVNGFTWWKIDWNTEGLDGWSTEVVGGYQLLFRRPPDLEIRNLNVSDNEVAPGEKIELEIEIQNNGPGASAQTDVYIYYSENRHSDLEDLADDSDLRGGWRLSVPSISEGRTETLTYRVDVPTAIDSYYYGALLPSNIHASDNTDHLDEDAIRNNLAKEERVRVVGTPDYIVDSILLSGNRTTFAPGDSFTLRTTVRNIGFGEPSSSATLDYYRSSDARISTSDKWLDDETVSRLGANETSDESIRLIAPSKPGVYYYGACVSDVRNESNRDNNCSGAIAITVGNVITPVEVAVSPDLVVTLSSNSNWVDPNEYINLTANIHNQGKADTLNSTTVRYYLSSDTTVSSNDQLLATGSVRHLTQGDSDKEELGVRAPSQPGQYYYFACVDSVTGEDDTGNNCSNCILINVRGSDLVVESVSVDLLGQTTGINPKGEFTLNATLRNKGTDSAASTTARIYISADQTFSEYDDSEVQIADISSLNTSRSTTIQFSKIRTPFTSGKFYCFVYVDGLSNETNTDNNSSEPIQITINNVSPRRRGRIPTQTLNIGAPKSLGVSNYFIDDNHDTLTYQASSSDDNIAMVTVVESQVTLTPKKAGSTTITVTANDGTLTVTQTVSVFVIDPNQAPLAVGTISALTLTVGDAPEEIDVSSKFRDPDNDNLKYTTNSNNTIVATATMIEAKLTITPKSVGNATITVTATDGKLTATQTVSVSVIAANRAPTTVGTISAQALIGGGSSVSVNVSDKFSDPDNDTLTYSASSSNTSIATANVSDSQVTIIPVSAGNATISVAASDGKLFATQTISVSVVDPNRTPVAVGTISDRTLTVGDSAIQIDVSSNFSDPDNDTLTYSASSNDDNVATTSTSGSTVTITPVGTGSATITVTASDGELTTTQTISVTITAVAVANSAPFTVGAISSQTLTIGDSAIQIDVSSNFSDPDNDTLTYSASSNDDNVATTSTSGSTVTITPVGTGSATITVTASDGELTTTQTISVTITAVAVANSAPFTVGAISSQTLTIGDSAIQIDVASNFSDPDGDTLTYTATSNNTNVATATVSGSQITITPVAAGSATITVTASDNDLTATQTISVTVTAASVANRAPITVGAISSRTLTVGEPAIQIDVSSNFQDPDSDTLTYSANSDDDGVATASALGSQITITPIAAGNATITVTASDGSLTATQTVSVTVIAAQVGNRSPEAIGSISARTLTVRDAAIVINVFANFSDPDGDTLTYSANSNNDSVATATVSGSQITITPVGAGSATITVTASDGELTTTQTISVTVTAAPIPNRAPFTAGAISSQTLTVDESATTVNVSSNFSDPDNDTLTYTASSNNNNVATASASGAIVTITPVSVGSAIITVTASDGSLSATQTISVTVEAATPTITLVNERTQQVQDAIVATVDGIDSADDITATHLAAITALNLSGKSISSLKSSDFDGLTALTSLRLSENSLSDISVLSGLTSLTSLRLDDNSISDISVLSGLTALTTLYLDNNSISDISVLSGLTALTTLYLNGNSASDISAVSGLTTLTILDLGDNSISDISTISGLTSLTRLWLYDNSISDISVLSGLTSLTRLDLSNNSISDVSALEDLTSLRNLFLSGNSITDYGPLRRLVAAIEVDGGSLNLDIKIPPVTITPVNERTQQVQDAIVATVDGIDSADDITATHLAAITALNLSGKSISSLKSSDFDGLTALTSLRLSSNSISDISVLSGLTSLTELRLDENSISDISAVSGLTALTKLYLDYNSISDISVLSGLTALTELYLSGNSASDLSALSGLTALTVLDLGDNSISNISAVSGLTSLTRLWLYDNSISDISAVSGLTSLTRLDLSNNSISDVSALEDLTSLRNLFLSGNSITDYGPLRTLVAAIEADGARLILDIRIPTAAPAISNPTQTSLLPNYPNPFNPETWIPYQLSKPSDIILTFYNVQGVVVRDLALGHRAAGVYYTRTRAAHWDGKNNLGEKVSTGVYFVKFKAGNYTKTRKMLIRK